MMRAQVSTTNLGLPMTILGFLSLAKKESSSSAIFGNRWSPLIKSAFIGCGERSSACSSQARIAVDEITPFEATALRPLLEVKVRLGAKNKLVRFPIRVLVNGYGQISVDLKLLIVD